MAGKADGEKRRSETIAVLNTISVRRACCRARVTAGWPVAMAFINLPLLVAGMWDCWQAAVGAGCYRGG